MRFNCGPTWDERLAVLQQWHPFFTLIPRRVGPRDCRWLETIERKGAYHNFGLDSWWSFEYRAPHQEETKGE